MKLGTLEFSPALEHPELVAPVVFELLKSLPNAGDIGVDSTSSAQVAAIDPTLSDTTAFCSHYQIGIEQAANCVILEAKCGESSWLAACVILGSTRADVNGTVRRTLDAKKVSFAPMDRAVAESHMEFGAITPVGLPSTWPILVDQAVAESDHVIIGSGIRGSKLAVPGSFLATLPTVQTIEGLAQQKFAAV